MTRDLSYDEGKSLSRKGKILYNTQDYNPPGTNCNTDFLDNGWLQTNAKRRVY